MHQPEATELRSVFFVPLLAAISGSCGLAYEILFARLFSNYFGNNFLMSGIILSGVFFGIAFGAWQSKKFSHSLAWIEIAIGIYAAITVSVFSNWGFEIAGFAASPITNVAKLIVLLGLPAFLIGTCVPLFSAYASNTEIEKKSVFTRIYGLYNFGAFLSVLLIEFVLFRTFGLQITGYVIASLNLTIGACLLWLRALPPTTSRQRTAGRSDTRIFMALFMASIASGVFQLFVLRLSYSVFGPLHENFAIILASAIGGVALGAWIALRGWIGFKSALSWLSAAILMFFVFVPGFIDLWIAAMEASRSDHQELIAKIAILAGFPLPIFILLGALVPLAAEAHSDDPVRVSGPLLAVSSLGNGIGVLLMYCVLHPYISLPIILLILSALMIGAACLVSTRLPKFGRSLGMVCMIGALVFSGFKLWPDVQLLLGYRVLASRDQLDHNLKTFQSVETYKSYDQNASVVQFSDGVRSLVFNGYRSLTFGPLNKSDLHEEIVGATPALFSQATKNALVLGLGTGITAGSTARLYERTRVVEINPAMFEIPKHFALENQGIMTRSSAEIILDDGISMLLQDDQVYDAIINTVTSPRYYSASKLYTRDFYDIVKARLPEKGIYSSWFDLNIGQDGISIMLNTLEASFAHCRYFVLSSSYFNVVCSDAPLIYLSSNRVNERIAGKAFGDLFAKYGFSEGFAGTMSALEVSFEEDFLKRNSRSLNTLNLPAIEFVVARKSDQKQTGEVLSDAILANIDFQRKSSFGNRQWRENCQTIARMSQLEFTGC